MKQIRYQGSTYDDVEVPCPECSGRGADPKCGLCGQEPLPVRDPIRRVSHAEYEAVWEKEKAPLARG